MLDWELAHLGDPIEDLGWFCVKSWRFGNVDQRVGGFGSADELLARLRRRAAGTPVDAEHLHFWVVFGTLKWGVICEMQTFTHLNGLVRSVELAALGRRVAETGVGPARPPRPAPHDDAVDRDADRRPADGAETVHDRPTTTELVGAVREFLERDVMAVTEGRVGFHARVAANVLAMVERELALGPAQAPRRARRASPRCSAPTARSATSPSSSPGGSAPARSPPPTAPRSTRCAATVRAKLAVTDPATCPTTSTD